MGGGFLMFHGKRGWTPLIGPVGGLIQLHGSSSVEVTRPARVTKSVALSGRVTSQRGPAPRREWSVAVSSAYPEHFQALQQLEAGLLGPGPYSFYDEYAQVTNMLSPAQSMVTDAAWSGGAQGGAGNDRRKFDAESPRYLSSITGGLLSDFRLVDDVPVPAQFPLTASAYMSTHPTSSATFYVDEIDPEGAVVGTHQVSVSADQYAQRAVVSMTTSVRTVAVRVRAVGALMLTLPAVTLTEVPAPWAHGAGCQAATFDLSGHTVLKAVAHPNGRRASYSMTVHELG